jgi:hypothetical protein
VRGRKGQEEVERDGKRERWMNVLREKVKKEGSVKKK